MAVTRRERPAGLKATRHGERTIPCQQTRTKPTDDHPTPARRGAPTHRWVIARADIAGRGSATTRVVEVCESCHAIRIDTDVEVVGQ